MSKIAMRIIFSGSVQGVGFRFTACSIARRYGLSGQVKNTPDGRVEIFVQGLPEDISDCIRDLRETFAVRDVKTQDVPINEMLQGFDIAF